MTELVKFKIKDDMTFLGAMKEMLADFYKETGGVNPLSFFYHQDTREVALIRPPSFILEMCSSLKGEARIKADIQLKEMLLKIMFSYRNQYDPDEYAFMTEMWFKETSTKDKSAEELIANHKSGDVVRDPESREGAMLHYETKTSFIVDIYMVKRKYEEGKVLDLKTHMTDEDVTEDQGPRGNFVNILYKPERHNNYG